MNARVHQPQRPAVHSDQHAASYYAATANRQLSYPTLASEELADICIVGGGFSGLNTATYRHYIDFAAEYGLDYVMFDAGWSDNDDNTKVNPDIDVPGLIAYARGKGVRVLLWNEALALERNLDEALDRYAAWGASGIMVDFMDRDDQPMLRFQEHVASEAAKRRLLVDLHGVAKPTGLQMPAFHDKLDDQQVAAVVSFIRNAWGNRGSVVSSGDVGKQRQQIEHGKP